jgi:hypothetical protein
VGRIGMSLEFGVFDHLDRNSLPLRDYYEQRLKVIEPSTGPASTPITSPSITSRRSAWPPRPACSSRRSRSAPSGLRFGTFVYALAGCITRCGCSRKSACSTT